jgi:hypothetical protein
MKTYRDVTVFALAILWMLSNITSFLISGDIEIMTLTSMICLVIVAMIVLISKLSTRFNNWLNKKI